MLKVNILDHALAKTYITVIRDKNSAPELFRSNINRLTTLLIAEVCRSLPLKCVEVETPLTKTIGDELEERIAFVPILRAGIGMCHAAIELIPSAEIFHLGIYRDEDTLEPIEYYKKFSAKVPDRVFIIDPMLATGGSANSAIERVKKWGVKEIHILCIVAAPEGVELLNKNHSDIPIYTCVLDDHLNEDAYIVPGLGDAGDRFFNT